MGGQVKLLKKRKGSMTVTVRMSGQVKLLKERKGSVTVTVRMSRQVKGWTSKTFVRTKGIR